MAAEHEGGDVLDRDVEFVGEEVAEARRVEHAGHADDHAAAAGRSIFCSAHTMASSGLVMQMTKALGAYFLMPEPTCSITFEIDVEQIVAAHAGLARHAGGDDARRRRLRSPS